MARKTFRFSLQSVLDLRRREAEEAEHALGRAVQERRAHEEQFKVASRQRAEACADDLEGPLDLTMIRRRAGFLNDLRDAEAEAARCLNAVLEHEADARRTLTVRRQPEEALKVLREQEVTAHRHTRAKAENAFLDEQASAGHRRKNNAPRS